MVKTLQFISMHILLCILFWIKQEKEDFIEHLAGEYSYEVFGGLHTLLAKQELNKDQPGNEIIMTCCLFLYSLFNRISKCSLW